MATVKQVLCQELDWKTGKSYMVDLWDVRSVNDLVGLETLIVTST